jgi:alkylresorcinol/alkylpyrone synthase
MYLHSLAHAVPAAVFSQADVWEILRGSSQAKSLKPRSLGLLEKILLGQSGIHTRHVATDDPARLLAMTAGELNAYYESTAPVLGSRALDRALAKANIQADAIDALVVATCTGYLCPGPSSHIAEQSGLREDCHLADLVGLGCGAALPALRSASHFLAAHPEAIVAVVAVEVCSAAFFMTDDPAVLISLCLFGDAASASIWRAAPGQQSSGRLHGFRSVHQPVHREKIRFTNHNGFLRNQLDRCVPGLAGATVAAMTAGSTAPLICHPGGRDVLDAIAAAIPGQAMDASRSVLRQFGNCSSPSVLLALEEDLHNRPHIPSRMLASFGAGFSCHVARFDATDSTA